MDLGKILTFLTSNGALLTFLSGILLWFLNEKKKRIYEEYKRKEERYMVLLNSLEGFYVESCNVEKIGDFLRQLRLCWLYCPDDVIRKANSFLKTVISNHCTSDTEKEDAIGELVLAMRKDLLRKKPVKRTSLVPKDFKLFTPNTNRPL